MMDCISVLDIARCLISISGSNSGIEVSDNISEPHEAKLLKLDISKARSNLLWHPKISIKESLGLIWSWEKARRSGENTRMTTKSQISNYQSLINQ
jgi:CDP-glucose 4,6-dehydratase